jgi:hypothetical protein
MPAVFLHTGWRSGGTWIWARLRAQPGVRAFYEPLHDVLATLDRAQIARETPDAWNSRHGGQAPYFAEYAPLLRQPRGVRAYDPRFAHEPYFLDPDAQDRPLHHYLDSLLHAAAGQVPVFKFCRSLGRVAWMQRRFPDALHAVLLRDPVAQWASVTAQLAAGNRFFAAAPLLVLARNREALAVREAVERFGLRLPALPASRRDLDPELCWRHAARFDEAARYRLFLAFWTITAISALSSDAMIIDADRLAADQAHGDAVAQALRAHTGTGVSLDTSVPPSRAQIPAGGQAAHAAALALLHARKPALPPPSFALIEAKLSRPAEPPASPEPAAGAPPGWRDAEAADAASRLRRALYFALIGASMPLRRLHGQIALQNRKKGLLF